MLQADQMFWYCNVLFANPCPQYCANELFVNIDLRLQNGKTP